MKTLRLQVISDLHCEFHRSIRDYFRRIAFNPTCKALVVAGDLHVVKYPEAMETALRNLCDRFDKVFYVLGNHEFYGSSWKETYDKMADIANRFPNLVWLRNGQSFVYEGITFHGDTMWFPEHKDMWQARLMINDFHQIKHLEENCHAHSADFMATIRSNCKRGDVVISHHLPHSKSIHPRYAGLPSNCVFFNAQAEDLFQLENRPGVWIHGHTHERFDYEENGIRVFCNPVGYPSEKQLPEAIQPSSIVLHVDESGAVCKVTP